MLDTPPCVRINVQIGSSRVGLTAQTILLARLFVRAISRSLPCLFQQPIYASYKLYILRLDALPCVRFMSIVSRPIKPTGHLSEFSFKWFKKIQIEMICSLHSTMFSHTSVSLYGCLAYTARQLFTKYVARSISPSKLSMYPTNSSVCLNFHTYACQYRQSIMYVCFKFPYVYCLVHPPVSN